MTHGSADIADRCAAAVDGSWGTVSPEPKAQKPVNEAEVTGGAAVCRPSVMERSQRKEDTGLTQERKDQLYEAMIAWICEHVSDDKELFQILHGQFEMTKEGIHDHSISFLDTFFDKDEEKEQCPQAETQQATELSQEEVHALLDSGEETGEYSPRGYFYTKEGDTFVAIDNSTGDGWTEEFQSLKECTDWLFGLGEWGLDEQDREDGPAPER